MIRKASFNGGILHMEFSESDLLMCIGNTLHILNMNGLIREDVLLPSNEVKEILKFKDIVFLEIETYGHYYFKIDNPILVKIECRIEKIHVGNNVIFSHGCGISFLDIQTFQPWHIVTMPSKIVDFAEVGSDIYVLVEDHLCLVQYLARNRKEVSIKSIGFLSHLKFVSATSNKLDLLILESNYELILYRGETLKSIRKGKNYRGFKIFNTILIFLLSDGIEMYSLNSHRTLVKLYFPPKAIAYDSHRKILWLYSDFLYEVDVSKLAI
ncbi:uncharacterized protein Eint_041610 [Encephalitozoon intestinalis ATCC 50506]|uniref:CNH domain-containing protein n=1 Tax=Encephalitozoon intestinalis (strain ATCC 50506) TaxID=876142 RepID=E0S6W3_ENCIT|nr:uncharacterized protein Eint_041610 [Encephalitozoon intestinalis ATCC 50506]ADM11448.2 hypothetical protein Eint_041610 [Encephalitozoon intestinalis ATCC 50506]UTX45144.1 hypothetical protein GPK93_04g06840 [Encephalitozoon intestinalis]